MFKMKSKKVFVNHLAKSNDAKLSSFYQPSPIDVFLCRKHKAPHSPDDSLRCTSDIYMLFNQQRLSTLTREALLNYFDNITPQNDALSSLRKRCTDDQLITLVKSRYIQAPSELIAWSNYLNTLTNEELAKLVPAEPAEPNEPNEPAAPAAAAPAAQATAE